MNFIHKTSNFGIELLMYSIVASINVIRYDVAALANLKVECPVQKKLVETICKGLEQDDEWDEEDVFQRGYKEAGLKRYKLDKKLLTSSSEKESYQEVVSSSSSKDVKAAPKALLPGSEPNIKIQNPEHVQMQNLVKTSKSASAAVSTLAGHFKRLLPSLLVMDSSPEGLIMLYPCFNIHFLMLDHCLFFFAGQGHIDKCRLCISNLDALFEELGVLVVRSDKLPADQVEDVKAFLPDVAALNEKAEHSLDAAKLVKNKLTAFLASK